MNKIKSLYEKAPAVVSLILCAALLTVFGAAYFIIGMLPYSLRVWDATPNNVYTLHPETVSVLEGLEVDVEVVLVTDTGIKNSNTVEKLLTRYAERSKHLKLTYASPAELKKDYGELTAGCAVVKSALRETVIYSADLYDLTKEAFDVSYNFFSYMVQSGFQGTYADFMYSGYAEYYGLFDLAVYQSTFTNAIIYASCSDVTTLYTVTEHGESILNAYLYPELRESFTELKFGKLADGIPAYADGVLINNPTSDISAEDAVILGEYLDNGGNITLMTEYNNIKKLPNLLKICEEYGLTTDGGFICEDDTNYNYGGYATAILPIVNADAFAGYLPPLSDKPLTTWGTGITVTEVEGVTVDVLMKTSPNAYTKQDIENQGSYNFDAEKDKRGEYALATVARNTANGSSVLWIASTAFGDSDYNTFSMGNNYPVFVGALSAQYDSAKPVEIPAVDIITEPLETTDGDFAVIMVFSILIPAGIIAFGVYNTVKRRKTNLR